MRVLVVDSLGRAGPLTKALKHSYVVHHATYAEEIDNIIKRDRPHAIFVNLEVGGEELVQNIRARCPHALLIATMAHPSVRFKRRVCESCDVDAFLDLEEATIAGSLLDQLCAQGIQIQ